MIPEKKVCKGCNEEKELTEFYKHKTGKYGFASKCKECAKAQKKKYYQENAERIKAQEKKYREENPEKAKKYYQENTEKEKAYQRKYYQENAEKVKAQKKKYYQENAEQIKAQKKKYYQENTEKERARKKNYYQENPEIVKARKNKWRQENLEKARATGRLAEAKRRAQKINTQVEDITDELLNKFWIKNNIDPQRCHYCDEGLYEHLEHCIPLSRGGTHAKDNLVPSCAACNLSKGTKTPDEWDKYRGL